MTDDRLKKILNAILQDTDLHARWVNTFSYLEYIGFRKIIKTQRTDQLDSSTMMHALEEGRHTMRLKRAALKLGGPKFDNYGAEVLLCGREANAYFQELDQRCENELMSLSNSMRAKLVYLYVTWIVEQRALEVYGQYQQCLDAFGAPFSLAGLLKEEVEHLKSVETQLVANDPHFKSRVVKLKIIESHLYENYLSTLENFLSNHQAVELVTAP